MNFKRIVKIAMLASLFTLVGNASAKPSIAFKKRINQKSGFDYINNGYQDGTPLFLSHSDTSGSNVFSNVTQPWTTPNHKVKVNKISVIYGVGPFATGLPIVDRYLVNIWSSINDMEQSNQNLAGDVAALTYASPTNAYPYYGPDGTGTGINGYLTMNYYFEFVLPQPVILDANKTYYFGVMSEDHDPMSNQYGGLIETTSINQSGYIVENWTTSGSPLISSEIINASIGAGSSGTIAMKVDAQVAMCTATATIIPRGGAGGLGGGVVSCP
ncbi:MAG: hypothetical protein H6619_00545 [Deltaproteobacteria bacterium]|nr:hypothetical protein [Deltaproteobacteria bacterium]